MKPMPGVRLTLVSRDVLTPYSGMLPAYVAGHYTHAETHIDLARLCQWAGVRFIQASVAGLDLENNRALLDDRPELAAVEFDVVSVNTGSTPDTESVEGASEFAVPVKPVNRFAGKWQSLKQRLSTETGGNVSIAVVGAGVGGFELLLSIHHALAASLSAVQLHWVIRGDEPLRRQPAKVRSLALENCRDKGIEVHRNFDVARVEQTVLHAKGGESIQVDEVLWVTAATAPQWPGLAGLETVGSNFIAVNDFLQSTSHPQVFACGDVATQISRPSPKAGVFAVRQAPVLFENLRRAVTGRALQRYKPQKNFLSLISLGEESAVGSRNGIVVHGNWVWRWKDWIDKTFMRKFSDLPERVMPTPAIADIPAGLRKDSVDSDHSDNGENSESSHVDSDYMFCGGCGAKVGPEVLASVLSELQPCESDAVVDTGHGIADDSCIIDAQGRRLVQSVDQIRANINDPYLFGRIAALHALSDVYAAGGEPDSALALVTIAFSEANIQRRDLAALMAGAVEELNAAGCMLAGGHSSVGPEAMLGFVVNGFERVSATASATASAAAPASVAAAGDVLIITKPLGTGVVMAAHMRAAAQGEDVAAVIQMMLQSNGPAAGIFTDHDAIYMTDVTGFGLLGHMLNLLDRVNHTTDTAARQSSAGDLQISLNLSQVPVLDAALDLSERNFKSSLYTQNAHFRTRLYGSLPAELEAAQARERLLMDPQTNGGMLAIVPQEQASRCFDELAKVHADVAIIGSLQAVSKSLRGSPAGVFFGK